MGDLLNLVGLSAGIVLYAMLLLMVIRTRRRAQPTESADPLLLATAVLGLVWNLCALPVYELLKIGMVGPYPLLTTLGFSALGLLPAVAVHSVLRRDSAQVVDSRSAAIVAAAYGASALAAVLHVQAFATGTAIPSAVGMRLLTYAFLALLIPLAIVTRNQERSRRALWAAALSIFAVSALHLSQFHQGQPSWTVELLGHHSSIPLAIAILYQDFPFALADLFLKRAITLLALVSLAVLAFAAFGNAHVSDAPAVYAREFGPLVALWVATALAYPVLQRLSSWLVDSVILRRPDYAALRSTVSSVLQAHDAVPALLDAVCAQLGTALSARAVRWVAIEGEAPLSPVAQSVITVRGATVDVPVTDAPRYRLEISALAGGRRILSDDRLFLESVATQLARRIDALRFTAERVDREIREQEMAKLATEAELRALRSQINPHFLFNALTTVGYLIQTSPPRALDTLMRLTSLLRGVLRSEGELTTLGRELELVEAYLDIESARFEERLQVRIDVPDTLRSLRLPPLLLQPLIENAVKHGIAPDRVGGRVSVDARLDELSRGHDLVVRVHNTGADMSDAALQRGRAQGVGLVNIERRIAMQYGDRARLTLESRAGEGTTATLRVPADVGDVREAAPVGVRR